MNMTIGERIKQLRKQNDLTQEKLADFLCVSCQAVSKWECGTACPDLALIGPLTKLLHVSADELLGLVTDQTEERRRDLEEAYEKTWNTGALQERYQLAQNAVNEFPGDMKYLCWLASCEQDLAHECREDSQYQAMLEKSVRHFSTVIENTAEHKVKCEAISGIAISLSLLHRKEEGQKYAALYPEPESLSRRDIMDWLLCGDEKRKNYQELLEIRFSDFIRTLMNAPWYDADNLICFETACEMIKIMIPDNNYLYYNDFLYFCFVSRAAILTRGNHFDQAMEMLNNAYFHAVQYDKMIAAKEGKHRYTAPMLELVEVDTARFVRSSPDTNVEGLLSWLDGRHFEPLRGREDFEALKRKCC